MTPQEFTNQLTSLLHQRPFVPFTVELLSGVRFAVDRPDAVAWCSSAAGFVDAEGEVYLFDDTRTRGFHPQMTTADA